jgi:hypothetical protein
MTSRRGLWFYQSASTAAAPRLARSKLSQPYAADQSKPFYTDSEQRAAQGHQCQGARRFPDPSAPCLLVVAYALIPACGRGLRFFSCAAAGPVPAWFTPRRLVMRAARRGCDQLKPAPSPMKWDQFNADATACAEYATRDGDDNGKSKRTNK